MVHVTLIQPPFQDRCVHFPLGLAYLGSILEKNDIDVSLIDLNFSNEKKLKNAASTDIIGISCMTKTYPSALQTAKKIKEVNSDVKIIFGGPHPTVVPEICQEESIDFCVMGEGEYTFLDLIQTIEKQGNFNNVNGIAFQENGNIKSTQPRPPIMNLDNLPFPGWHLFDINKYIYNIIGVENVKKIPWISVITSRGCPNRCIFCNRQLGKLYRMRSPKNVVEELEILTTKYKIKEILFVDDNFTLSKKRTIEICDQIIERGLDIVFRFPSGIRIDSIDKEMLLKLKKAGLYSVAFGIESGSQRMLKIIKKDININQIKKSVSLCHKLGIEVIGFFVIGFQGETFKSALKTIEFAKKIPLDDAAFYVATPYPGTEFYDWASRKGFLNNCDWSKFGLLEYTSVCRTDDLTSEQISILVKKASREFYFRPLTLIKKLFRFRSLKEFKFAYNEVSKWFKFH